MTLNTSLPSYEKEFGELNFKQGDDARSVYSPAAYLADLLQLLDDYFKNPDLENRRPDLKSIPLDTENTFSLIPYLDIVNGLLEDKLPGNAYETLKPAKYPFNLPFNLEDEKVKLFLKTFDVSREALYKLFHFQPEPTIVAKSYLGLSQEMFEVITLSSDAAAELKRFYNLDDKHISTLQVVSVFMETTGVSGSELRELLYQNLNLQETALAKLFFINQGLNGYAILDPNEERLVWKKPGNSKPLKNITIEWFSRVNRIIRLSQQTGISLTDLDLILRSCCNNDLNETAIQTIAIIKQIASIYDLEIDVVCSFFKDINTVGLGSDDAPTDLFNRIFNVNFSELDHQYFQASTFVPEQYNSFKKLTLSGDLFSVNNADTKKRLLKALHISQKDLKLLVTTLEKRLADIQLTEDKTDSAQDDDLLKKLSLYYRVSTLAQTMDMTIQDLFDLLDLLQQDPTIRQYSNFNPLINFTTEELNCYKIIANGSIEQSMWLVQMLLALSSWMQKSQYSSAELKAIQRGEYRSEAEQIAADKKTIVGFNTLYQQFKPILFKTDYFVSEQVDERTARVIYDTVQANEMGLVSKKDNRLVLADKEKAEQAIYYALNQLQVVSAKDFTRLGVQEKLQDKIFTNLILNGYIQTDGTLIEEALATCKDKLNLNNSFDSGAVFDLIHNIQESLTKNEYTGELKEEFVLFLSDLDVLELAETHQKELYDNLAHSGYLDEEGNVNDPYFFDQAENRDLFDANTYLNADADAQKIYAFIKAKKAAFYAAECLLNKELFTALPLKDIEVVDLIENLKFNDYINDNNVIINKTALLSLKVDNFNLALMYYPYRHKILAIIQSYLQHFKSRYYTLSAEDFSEVSDEIIANDIYSHLQNNYLDGDNFTQESLDFFINEENSNALLLGQYFDNNANSIVFEAIRSLINISQQYRLHLDSFEDLELTESHVYNLFELMAEKEYINVDGTLQPNQIAYFLNINNALDIKLEGYEDFSKDIFFVIHALAKVIENTVQTLVTRFMELAQQQEDVLFSALQELFELPADRLKVICRHVFNNTENRVEYFVAPILASLDSNQQITQKPKNYCFNITFNRIQQFAKLATKLDLNAVETDIVFRDQSLAEKFSEKLNLPQGIDHFDCLLQLTIDSKQFVELKTEELLAVIFLYSSEAKKYWLYEADDYQLLTYSNDLSKISPLLANLPIDAAFNDQKGNAWIISGENFFCQQIGKLEWAKKQKQLGKVNSNFESVEKIDAAFIDRDNKIYLFAGDQYLRSSKDLKVIDEGYPKKIQGNWAQEHGLQLPERYNTSIDAAFLSPDDKLYFFKDEKFINSDDFHYEIDINQFWGKVKNNFADVQIIDATFVLNEKIYLFADDQCITWSYSLENEHGLADEGSIQSLSTLIPSLPDAFKNGIDAIFRGFDNKIHIFKDANTLLCSLDFKIEKEVTPLNKDWGKVSNRIISTGKVSAAFSGLDGNAYVFSGTQYLRYSGSNFSTADEGYPKTIANNWGGLKTVDAAFILDGKTYLMGKNKAGKLAYIRYSSNDYSIQDMDYPKLANDNWWTDHFNLNSSDFTTPDTVFIGQNGITYLFKDQQYIAYDKIHRWWSQPKAIKDKWAGIPFDRVDAAFTGKDGRTYLFSSTKYARYSDKLFNKLDDRYPKNIKQFWGQLKNNIHQYNKVDAAAAIKSKQVVTENGQQKETIKHYTYLFSGNQFFRYSGEKYDTVDEGYPKTIETSLKDEPRFSYLSTTFKDGIDAAFADRRSIYLFKNNQCTVVSETDYKVYENLAEQSLTAVVEDQGALYIQTQDGWHTLKNLEGEPTPVITASAAPPMLRDIPNNFKDNIDAAFIGADKGSYVFKEGQCYNDLLEKSYPINEEWGRERNNVLVDNHVDAVFVGTDGKTYLFSGDQFLSYTPEEKDSRELPEFVDSHPKLIKDHWGGLYNVNLAFVKEGKTYLLESPDKDGIFRYVCYSSDDYSQPDSEPQSADISWWEMPSVYQEEGFDYIDAVLIEDEHMFLFNQDQFIHYNEEEDLWTYPRPINLIWKGLPFNDEMGKEIITVFKGIGSKIYFFNSGYVTSYTEKDLTPTQKTLSPEEKINLKWSPAEKINLSWGKVRNNILLNNQIDAAVVLDHQITYLFSGDQYVRYSTDDYRFIDAGYPKLLIENLRQETGFKYLPESFDKRLKELQTQQLGISGIVANERNRYIFETKHCHVVSKNKTGQFDINRLCVIKNSVSSSNQVNAAFVNLENQTFLFSGDQYVRYSDTDYDYVDEGYPKSIVEHFPQEKPSVTVEELSGGLDAALRLKTGKLYLFNGKDLYQSGTQNTKKPLTDVIPVGQNIFTTPINAAFVATDGKAYFFKDGHYIRYSDLDNEFVDEGFPRTIKDHWGNLPAAFEEAIDHAFVFEDRTYLVNGNDYVRYSNINYQMIDAIYPQKFAFRWGPWSDYLLSDIKIITEYKELQQHSFSNNDSLNDLLDLESGYKKQPYQMLSDIFNWDIEQVKWLKRKNAFYNNKLDVEVNFNIELILKMQAIFNVSDKMGAMPSSLYKDVYKNDFETNNTALVAQTLYQWLGLKHSTKDWKLLSRELHDKLNKIKHDALLPYVIANDNQVDNARDLFAKLLIDVEMGSEAMTSKVKEAIAAIQLYVHRYFVNLETINLKNDNKAEKREQLKQWWKWMKNYRVWEANRKVFLYPENYIRPELRDTKTPEFKQLEETLLSGEINQEIVTRAYNDYLNQFSIIGNLKICGANVYLDPLQPDDHILILFAYTRTEPQQFYYRTARFLKGGKINWDNWTKISITMKSTRVFPVYAFGRVLVFWIEIEDYEESNAVILNDKSTSKVNTNDKILKHRADIKYSFYDFNNQWINPQTLKKGIELDYKIEAAFSEDENIYAFSGKYCIKSTPNSPDGNIREIKEVFKNIHQYFHSGIDAVTVFEGQKYFFKDSNVAVENGSPQPIKNHFRNDDDDMFAHFGTDFPFQIRFRPIQQFHPVQEYEKGVAAAFTQEDTICLIDLKGGFTFYRKSNISVGEGTPKDAPPVFESNPDIMDLQADSFWFSFLKIITNSFLKLDPVDAIFKDKNNVLYFLRNGLYDCYLYDSAVTDKSKQLQELEGFPKPIKGNLSFNMDKFFNKLHVVQYRDIQGEFINLSYITPKEGTLLLNGKITSDFEFKEGSLQIDFAKINVLRQEQSVTADALNYDPEKHTEVERLLNQLKKSAEKNELLDDIKHLENGLSKLEEAIVLIDQTIPTDQQRTEGEWDVSESLKKQVDDLLVSASVSFKKTATQQKQMLSEGLINTIDVLQTAFEAYAENTSDDNLKLVIEANAAASEKAKEPSFTDDLISIKSSVNGLIENGKSIVKDYIEYHSQIYNSYQSKFNFISNFIDENDNGLTKFSAVFSARHREIIGTVEAYKAIQREYKDTLKLYGDTLKQYQNNWPIGLKEFVAPNTSSNLSEVSQSLSSELEKVKTNFEDLNTAASALNAKRGDSELHNLHELYFGKFDLFPANFEIETQTNFTFSQPDWYVFEAKKGTFLAKPPSATEGNEETSLKYEIVRLTTTTIPEINNKLFAGGIKSLLTLDTQLLDEKPYFSSNESADTIKYNANLLIKPVSDNLDFRGANANYYWEIFFHAPFLIAQSLNTAQKFEEAKEWYEYIFDPSKEDTVWQFQPLNKDSVSNLNFPADLEEYLSQTINITDLEAEIKIYLDDPFDPHAIANLREVAYKKAIVMRYVDNLLDWGDMLFGQYTMESINEARMLYILAYDLLGKKPENIGKKKLSDTTNYNNLSNETADKTDLLSESTVITVANGTPNETVVNPYFFIPANTLFHEYWNRVEDRLFKIRNSLNIDGVKQALPLFQPPIDPMSIVQAIGSGASLSQALAGRSAPVPHYRFSFMIYKVKELASKLNQFGGELLSAIEKKDSEEIALLQNKHEKTVLAMMTNIKEAQLAEARESINSLNANLEMVKANEAYNKDTFETNYLPLEIAQLSTMSVAVGAHTAATILKTLAAIPAAAPQMKIGIDVGPEAGGQQISKPFSEAAEAVESGAEGLSILGEIFGISAQHQRMMDDTEHAYKTAKYDVAQIESQIESAKIQIKIAEYELAIHRKEMEQQESINTFMKSKFSNQALYQWMFGKLSGMYYQTYNMALDMAKSAEKAFQFEKGLKESDVNFIKGMYWDSQRKGLLSGDQLGIDLERMEQAYLKTDSRRFEISKSISLLELDPMAFIRFKAKGVCEFEFSEAFFDYDFQGHYCRQIKTIDISFDAGEGKTVNATLTQLNNKTVIDADPKAVKYLLEPKDTQPLSIRNDWRASQQIVLSNVDQYEKGHGLFELRYDDDHYLPFEGTGAVSKWRLELNGKRGSVNMNELVDLVINVKYTALQGGEVFANAVKGLLKPYETVRFFDFNYDFHDDWINFLDNEEQSLTLNMSRNHFPNMASGRITGAFTKFDLLGDGNVSLMLNNDDTLILRDEQFLETTGLSVSNNGSAWTFTVQGDKANLKTVLLVMGYKAKV